MISPDITFQEANQEWDLLIPMSMDEQCGLRVRTPTVIPEGMDEESQLRVSPQGAVTLAEDRLRVPLEDIGRVALLAEVDTMEVVRPVEVVTLVVDPQDRRVVRMEEGLQDPQDRQVVAVTDQVKDPHPWYRIHMEAVWSRAASAVDVDGVLRVVDPQIHRDLTEAESRSFGSLLDLMEVDLLLPLPTGRVMILRDKRRELSTC